MDFSIIDEILNEKIFKSTKLAKILYVIMNKFDIPSKSYCILGSYALRDYREINDIDVDLDTKHFKKLKNCSIGNITVVNNENVWTFQRKHRIINYKIEIYEVDPKIGFPNESFSLISLFSTSNDLQMDDFGHYHYRIKTVKRWKTIVRREKDEVDIILINSILNSVN